MLTIGDRCIALQAVCLWPSAEAGIPPDFWRRIWRSWLPLRFSRHCYCQATPVGVANTDTKASFPTMSVGACKQCVVLNKVTHGSHCTCLRGTVPSTTGPGPWRPVAGVHGCEWQCPPSADAVLRSGALAIGSTRPHAGKRRSSAACGFAHPGSQAVADVRAFVRALQCRS